MNILIVETQWKRPAWKLGRKWKNNPGTDVGKYGAVWNAFVWLKIG
jgi:hypothetical protein